MRKKEPFEKNMTQEEHGYEKQSCQLKNVTQEEHGYGKKNVLKTT